jgi:hypothetical protein
VFRGSRGVPYRGMLSFLGAIGHAVRGGIVSVHDVSPTQSTHRGITLWSPPNAIAIYSQ